MAKTKYNPLSAIKEDPLAGLKQATTERPSATTFSAVLGTVSESDAVGPNSQNDQLQSDTIPQSPPRVATDTRLSSAPVKPLSATLKPSRNTVYLYPEDATKLRQLSGYASTEHGVRANDSMIVRAALSLMETDVRFLHALREAELSDRRRTTRKANEA